MKLTNFIGNEKVVDSLSKLFEGGRFPHALIIEGEDGIGKKTLARDLACTLAAKVPNVKRQSPVFTRI